MIGVGRVREAGDHSLPSSCVAGQLSSDKSLEITE